MNDGKPWFFDSYWFINLNHHWSPGVKAARFEKESRYCEFHLAQDLLEDWIVSSISGQNHLRRNQTKHTAFPNFEEALDFLLHQSQSRYLQNFRLTRFDCSNRLFLYIIIFLLSQPLLVEDSFPHIPIRKTRNVAPRKTRSTKTIEDSGIQLGFNFF